MSSHLRAGVAAIALLASIGIAVAAEYSTPKSSVQHSPSTTGSASSPASTTGSASATDQIKLTSDQEHAIYQSVSKKNTREKAPSGFTASVGAVVPKSIKLHPLPSEATSQTPDLKRYDYAMLQNDLLIVNPMDKKVVDVIRQ